MSSTESLTWWVGTPQLGKERDDIADPYTSRIGGKAMSFRVGSRSTERLSAAALSKYFQCPQCRSTANVSLLSQVYAPLEVFDRVLYVLTCAACTRKQAIGPSARYSTLAPRPNRKAGKKGFDLAKAARTTSFTSFCFVVRSQNFSREYFAGLQRQCHAEAQFAAEAQKKIDDGKELLFDNVDDDWGDGSGSDREGKDERLGLVPSSTAAATPKVSAHPAPSADAASTKEEPAYPLAPTGSVVPLGGTLYTSGIPLDLFEEPQRKSKELTVEEQIAAVESMLGNDAVLDMSKFEEDDETAAEACVREYMEEMERTPSQCVRWCPGGTPIRTSLAPVGSNGSTLPPPCSACGAPRQFEMQLTAPLVYFLTKDIGEVDNTALHFSNVLVYTCSRHCYTSDSNVPYLSEYCVVEDEL